MDASVVVEPRACQRVSYRISFSDSLHDHKIAFIEMLRIIQQLTCWYPSCQSSSQPCVLPESARPGLLSMSEQQRA